MLVRNKSKNNFILIFDEGSLFFFTGFVQLWVCVNVFLAFFSQYAVIWLWSSCLALVEVFEVEAYRVITYLVSGS